MRLRFLAREVVQTSAMDCGPAALKCLLDSYGIRFSYGRLREACQTDVDGTSIDAIEETAQQLGLHAEQIMVPKDHLLLRQARALPAMVVTLQPGGATHFVVLWRKLGPWVQVMDPAVGRRWLPARQFAHDVYEHQHNVDAAGWRDWAGTDEFLVPLRARITALGVRGDDLLENAVADPRWRSLARLDAATRMVQALLDAGGVQRGRDAAQMLAAIAETEVDIPSNYWSASATPDDPKELQLRGAVLMRVTGRELDVASGGLETLDDPQATRSESPLRWLWDMLRHEGVRHPVALVAAAAFAALGTLAEAVLFRAMIDLHSLLDGAAARLGAPLAVAALPLLLLVLELPLVRALQRFGMRIELRLRLAFLEKLPRLGGRYFHSRLMSDLAERAHSAHTVRRLSLFGGNLVRTLFSLVFVTAGIIWLDPSAWWAAVTALAVVIVVPLAVVPFVQERNLRVRTHAGALTRYIFDSLVGHAPVRAHAAGPAIRREHEALTTEWARASFSLLTASTWVDGLLTATGMGAAALIVYAHLDNLSASSGAVLLLTYWALSLPVLGQHVGTLVSHYPSMRNVVVRLLEPLDSAEDESSLEVTEPQAAAPAGGMAVSMRAAHLVAAGHPILHDIHLDVAPGTHVAVVGASGSGKSSLVGLLVGTRRATGGRVELDGEAVTAEHLRRARRETVWIDPTVQIWNRPVLDNILYGNGDIGPEGIGESLRRAELYDVVSRLPEGLQTVAGESGGTLSGGEGQRVRLARGYGRREPRLVVLDEAFRSLERERRQRGLAWARELWADRTLFCVTHDIEQALAFDRVLVMADGRIVADGPPDQLAGTEDSPLARLLRAEHETRAALWERAEWVRMQVSEGKVVNP